jgi:hypothetical protein
VPIYRISFLTDLLVECESEKEAEMIGFKHLTDEVDNRGSEVFSIKLLESPDQVRRWERGSLPWRDTQRDLRGEPQKPVEQILQEAQGGTLPTG